MANHHHIEYPLWFTHSTHPRTYIISLDPIGQEILFDILVDSYILDQCGTRGRRLSVARTMYWNIMVVECEHTYMCWDLVIGWRNWTQKECLSCVVIIWSFIVLPVFECIKSQNTQKCIIIFTSFTIFTINITNICFDHSEHFPDKFCLEIRLMSFKF